MGLIGSLSRSDYSLKAAAYMPETIQDPETLTNGKTAFNRAYRTDLGSFAWLNSPEQAYVWRRFNMAMEGTMKICVPWEIFEGMMLGLGLSVWLTEILVGFDWQGLPDGSLVVDVGGGVGSQTLTLAKKFKHLNFVIQDTEATRPNAIRVSQESGPSVSTY